MRMCCTPGISFAESPGTSSPAESSESWFTETCLQDASSAECYACVFFVNLLQLCLGGDVFTFLHVRVTEECS